MSDASVESGRVGAAHAVDEILPAPQLITLGLQHVLVMYAGAIAVPLIVGRALQLSAEEVAFLISADLFVCGIVSIIQSLGTTQYFGIKLPVISAVLLNWFYNGAPHVDEDSVREAGHASDAH